MVSTDSPASPDPACTTDLARSPSPCLNLYTLSSSDDAEESVIPWDISVTVLCGSEDDNTLIGSDQVLSDPPPISRIREYRLKNCLQWIGTSDGRCLWTPENGPDVQQQHSACVQDSTPAVWPRANKPGLSVGQPGPSDERLRGVGGHVGSAVP